VPDELALRRASAVADKVPSSQRRPLGPAVHHLTDAVEQLLVGVRELAADGDHPGVEQVHHVGQRIAEDAGGPAGQPAMS
jgi:hypothetical protein